MASKFPLYVKSALDYTLTQLAAPLHLAVVDMDSAGLFAELLETDATAIVWAIGNLSESPADPLWYMDFDVGVKTSLDPAQYKSLNVVSSLTDLFKVGKEIQVRDYTGVQAGVALQGTIIITQVTSSPSQPDRLSGVRLINVQARVMRQA